MAQDNLHNLLEAERGHRRGVVLGLTMAEIMLLLLFCLLLVAASIMQQRDQTIAALTQDVAQAQKALDAAGIELPAQSMSLLRQLETENAALTATLTEQTSELVRLRELEQQAQRSFPQLQKDRSENTWRELVLATEASAALEETGATLDEAMSAIAQTRRQQATRFSPGGDNWPPMIRLNSDEFRFVRNSAELSQEFKNRLQTEVADQLADLLVRFNADVVEVVGHTDEQGITGTRRSTLDELAISAMGGTTDINKLVPADNAGLGLARAISVANALGDAIVVNEVKIIPLSAAHLVRPGDKISDGLNPADDADRRRIEIRVRRSDSGN
jgi:outer membrane protein OmpA-like peptidoglycan-associated protein